MANNKIQFDLGIKTSTDLTGINQLKKELNELKSSVAKVEIAGLSSQDVLEITRNINKIEQALDSAFDTDLDSLNLDKFNKSLAKAGINMSDIQKTLSKTGLEGEKAFSSLTANVLQTQKAVKQTNKFLDEMADAFTNTVRWTIMSSIVNNISGTIQDSYYYVKDLDSALNDIRVVTEKNADEMARFAVEANDAAKALAVSTKDYTKGSLIYYQQGLDDDTVTTLTDITAKTSNVTGQSMDTVSEQLTAVWNGYQVANEAALEGMQVYEEYVDKMAAVGAATASDLEELATAMSKVASAANSMGVDFDQLSAQIATIVSVTRQAPESVGTALKTIYARLGDLKLDGVDEFGTTLGEVSGNLAKVGIQVTDQYGNMRDMGIVMEEVAGKWDTWNESQKQAIAISMAGKRQYNNLLALFENWEKYTDTMEVATNAAGTLNKQQEIALDSINNKMDILRATAEDLYDNLFDEEAIKDIIDAMTVLLQGTADVVDAFDGLTTLLPLLGSLGVKVFSKQIGNGVLNLTNSFKSFIGDLKGSAVIFDAYGELTTKYSQFNFSQNDEIVSVYNEILEKKKYMTEADTESLNVLIKQKAVVNQIQTELEEQLKTWDDYNIRQQKGIYSTDANFVKNEKDNDHIDNLNKSIAEYRKAVNQLEADFANLGEEGQDSVDDIRKAYEKFQKILKNKPKLFNAEEIDSFDIKFNNLIANADKLNQQELDNFINELRQAGADGEKLSDALRRAKGAAENFDANKINLQEKIKAQETAQNITNVIGALGQLGSAIQMVNNIGDIWENEDLEEGEKMLQTFINFTSILGMSVGVIKTFNEVTGISEFLIKKNALAKIKETGDTEALIAAEEALAAARNKSILANPKLLIIMAALAAIVGVVAIAYNDYTKKLKRNTEIARENADKQIEVINAAKEHKTAIDGLVTSYQELKSQYTADGISLEELRTKTYDLCKQYGEQDLALQALIADYEYLDGLINGAKTDSVKGLQAEVRAGIVTEKEAVKRKAEEDSAEIGNEFFSLIDDGEVDIENDWTTFVARVLDGVATAASGKVIGYGNMPITGATSDQKAENEKLIALLEKYNLQNKNGHVDEDKFYEIITTQGEDFLYELDQLNTEESKKLADFIRANQDSFDKITDYKNQEKELDKELILFDATRNGIDNFDEYREAIDKMADEAKEQGLFETREQAYAWAKEALASETQYAMLAIDNAIFEKVALSKGYDIVNLTKEQLNEVAKEVENFNQSKKNFIMLYPDLYNKAGDLDTFFNKYSNLIDLSNQANIGADLETIFSNTEATELTQEQIDSLYGGRGDISQVPAGVLTSSIDKETFSQMDYGQQQLYMLEVYSEYQKWINENKEQLITDAQSLLAELEDEETKIGKSTVKDIQAYGDGNYFADKYHDDKQVTDTLEKHSSTFEDYNALLIKVSDEGYESLSAAEKSFLEDMQNVTEENKETTDSIGNAMAATDDWNQQITSVRATLAMAENATDGYKKVLEQVSKAQKTNNIQIDNLQSGYKSLTSIVDDYNSSGRFSIDNLQILLSLESDMLAALQFENGQLSINKVAIENLALARLNETKALILQETETGLLDILTNQATTSINDQAVATKWLGEEAENASLKAAEGIDAWVGYWEAATNGKYGDISQREDVLAFLDAQQKKLLAVDDVFKGIQENGLDFSMGADNGPTKEDTRELKEYIDEFDRYWEINKAIEAVAESLEDLDKVQSHLFGKELVANLQQQNALLDEQANKYETLFSMQKQEAAELQTALRGFGVAFDAAGGVSNYAAVTQAMLNAYNIEAISEEGYEQFKKLLERYEELFYGEMVDVQNQLDDIYYEQLANNLEAWEVEIELNFELNEAEREWSDFLKEINDDFKATYRDIGKEFANIFEHLDTYSRSGGTIATNIQALKDVQDAIATMQAGGSSDMFASVSEAEEKAKELKETLMEDVESVHGLWVNAWDAYMEGIDQASSKFDDLMSKFETIDEELEYQGELIELLYGTQAYELMDSLYDAQINNSLVQVDSLKQQANMWKELYDNAEEGSEEQIKYYEEWQEAQSNLNDAVVEHINLLKKDYSNTLDNILNKLEKDMTGGLGLDEMRENWEEVTAAAEKYYDATERIYELETLENKFQEAINNTSSLENQQKLKALMDDQLADLKAKEKLTEYDITLAEKRLEIAQAEMALEDARNAKNSMKLVRGANGNWEYQYVADEDDIAAKQQEMLDAYNNLYQFVKETQQESIESILNMTEQFFTKMNEIRNDDTLNEEQKMLKMEELREQYYGENGKITILQAEHAKYTEDLNIANAELLWGLYKADETNYGLMTEAQKVLIDDFINHSIEDYYALDQYITGTYDELQGKLEESTSESLITWNSAAAEMADAWNADDGVSVKAQVTEAFEEMQSALEEYEEGIETLEDTADTSFDNLVTDIESAIDATNDLKDATADLCDESIDALNDYKSKINEVEDAWYDVRDAVNAAMNAVGEANNSSSTNNANPTITPTAPGGDGGSGSGGGDGGSGSGGGDGGSENGGAKGEGLPTGELFVPEDEEVSDQPLFTKGQKIASAEQRRDGGVNTVRYWTWDGANMNSDQWTDFQFGSSLEGKTIAEQPKKYNGIWYYKIPFSTDKGNNWFREGQLVAYDTGGYTGDWSSRDGKLAMLHEKELVLNADDTKNILEVVQLTRDMASLTSSVGSAVMDGVKMMLYDLMGMKAPGNNMVMTPQVADGDNIFNITAEFPNANDVTSIREAILSLPNMASQYLSQNKK